MHQKYSEITRFSPLDIISMEIPSFWQFASVFTFLFNADMNEVIFFQMCSPSQTPHFRNNNSEPLAQPPTLTLTH